MTLAKSLSRRKVDAYAAARSMLRRGRLMRNASDSRSAARFGMFVVD